MILQIMGAAKWWRNRPRAVAPITPPEPGDITLGAPRPTDPPPMLFARWKDIGTLWEPARWPNFYPAELACNCAYRFCQMEYWHDPVFLDRLQTMRTALGRPIRINSGHRCAKWNAAVGGAPLSSHKTIAADIALAGHDRAALLAAARDAGFTGLGFGAGFLHVDVRPRLTAWGYGPTSLAVWGEAGVTFAGNGRRVTGLPTHTIG